MSFNHDHPSHSFVPFRAAGSKYASSRVITKQDIGCPNYDDGVEYLEEHKDKWLEEHLRTSRNYFLPPPSSNKRARSVRVCRNTFIHILGIGRCGAVVDKLANRDRTEPVILHKSSRLNACGRKPKGDQQIKDHLKSFPRVTSHYSRTAQQGKAKFFFDSTLSPSHLWQLWCVENDNAFATQARKHGFWPGYDRREPPQLLEGEAWIKPKLAYSTYMYKLAKYELYFGEVKADTCETCDDLKRERDVLLKAGSNTEAAKKEAALAAHLKEADSFYAARRADFERTCQDFIDWVFDADADWASFQAQETQCQDAAGNCRCPRMTIGEAYYKRILPVWIYGIHSGGRQEHTMCVWNETIGKKGSNDIISCEHWHHRNESTGALAALLLAQCCYARSACSVCWRAAGSMQPTQCCCLNAADSVLLPQCGCLIAATSLQLPLA
jgi:hypothetical protein